MSGVRFLLASLILIGTVSPAQAQPKFVELVADGKPYQGRVAARSDEKVWLFERDGRMQTLGVAGIQQFRKLSDSFTPLSAADLRDQLRRELAGGLEVVGTGHYLVAGPPQLVREYAQVFEDQYRAVYSYFSVRGFDVQAPEFPLVAIVFPDQGRFAKYALQDKVPAGPGLKGYYIQSSNRIALFHEAPPQTSLLRQLGQPFELPGLSNRNAAAQFGRELAAAGSVRHVAWANTEGDLQSTMIHEATHQVAFNIGIHPRVGNVNPRWVVEGLATAFEAPGLRSTSLQRTPGAKLNGLRLTHFRDFVKNRRQPKSLGQFVESDVVFAANVLDGYAQAWALTYFLIETRPREYSRLIKLIAARPPGATYEEEQRGADFKAAFGSDLVLLEAKFLRFIEDAK